MQFKMLLSKYDIQIFICSFSYALYFLSNNIIFGLIPFLVCISEVRKVFPYVIIFIFFSIYFIFLDLYTVKDFLILTLSTLLLSSKFSGKILRVLQINSYVLLAMLFYFLTLDHKVGDWQDVLEFKRRLFLLLPNGKELNPNPIGVICSICAIGFIFNKKYMLALLPLILLIFTQSRAAILLFFIIFIIGNGVSIRKLIIPSIIILPLIYFVSKTPLMDRFQEDGDGGRAYRYAIYNDVLNNHYITGYPAQEYTKMAIKYGTLDNMYLLLILKYGVFIGCGLLIFYVYSFMKNRFDEYYKLRLGIFSSCMIFGLFETGFVANYMFWMMFAMSFNGFSKFDLKLR